MNRTGNKIIAAMLAACMIIALAGCGTEQTAPSAGAETAAVPVQNETQTQAAETAAQAETKVSAETAAGAEAATKAASGAETAENPAASGAEAAGAEGKAGAENGLPGQSGFLHLEVTTVNAGLTEKESYYCKARLSYPKVLLSAEDEEAYPKLQKALEALNQEQEEKSREAAQRLSGTYLEITAGRPAEEAVPELVDEQEAFILRSDSNILSILNYTYANYGGAHPDHYYRSASFDPESGERLTLSDIVTDTAKLSTLADGKLKEEYAEIYEHFYSTAAEAINAADTADTQMAWTAGCEGLTLYFSPYCLGPYAMGEQVVTVYYEEAPELFEEKVRNVPESCIVPLVPSAEPSVDAAGIGKRERVSVTEEAEEEGAAFTCTVNCGGRSCRLADFCYAQKSFLVKANGQYYLYIFETSDNDHVVLSAVDLKTMVRNEDLMFNGSVPDIAYGYEENAEGYTNWQTKLPPTDPACFRLGTSVDYLSTQTGTREYSVGPNGWPVPLQEYYSLSGRNALRVKKEITVDKVDADGSVTGTAVLKPDTFLVFVRTDDRSFADFQEADAANVESEYTEWGEYHLTKTIQAADWSKPVYRIREDKSSWPFTIDRVPEDEILGGIGYAG